MSDGLCLRDVRIDLAGRTLLALDADIPQGQVFTVMGPSGSGKSSLLAWIAGFLPAAFTATGQVWVNGRNVTGMPAERRGIGLLFQDALLFPHLSVAGNLRFGLPAGCVDPKTQIETSLARMGLGGFADRDPATLSGGQRSRVALLRLLLSAPRAVLLDEPFANLDMDLRRELRRLVFDSLAQAGLPAILVTHDAADAEAAGGPVLTLTANR